MSIKSEGKISSGKIKSLALAGLDRGLILSGQVVAQSAQRKAPVDTGRLARSIKQGRPYSTSSGNRAIDIGTNVEYARIQEFGGKIPPRTITPRTKQALAFDWPNAPAGLTPSKSGKYVFKSVEWPGATIKAQPYLRPAIEDNKGKVKLIIIKSIMGAIKS